MTRTLFHKSSLFERQKRFSCKRISVRAESKNEGDKEGQRVCSGKKKEKKGSSTCGRAGKRRTENCGDGAQDREHRECIRMRRSALPHDEQQREQPQLVHDVSGAQPQQECVQHAAASALRALLHTQRARRRPLVLCRTNIDVTIYDTQSTHHHNRLQLKRIHAFNYE